MDQTPATKSLIYERELEKLVSFKIERTNSTQHCSCNLTPRAYSYNVAQGKILTTSNQEKIGYFRLDSFLGSITQQIDSAFSTFKQASITKLIIDLRYNGGGSIDIASELLNRLTVEHEAKEQFTLSWNSDYSRYNEQYLFKKTTNSLALTKIIFLTTQGSASASELVISAMKPYLGEENIIIIGDKTHGKPVGMGAKSDGYYLYFLINFVVKNSEGFYDYFDGLPVTAGCQIEDDPYHEMDDPNELMLKAAIRYIESGSCQ